MNILVVMELEPYHKTWLDEALGEGAWLYRPNRTASKEELAQAEVVIGPLPVESVAECPRLKWLQLSMAGAAPYCRKGLLPDGCELTNATGAYGLALAEHMLGALLAMQKKLYLYYDNQKEARWQDEGTVD